VSGRRWLAACAALALSMTAAACANLPTSGTIQVGKLHGSGGAGPGGVQLIPAGPSKGMSPKDIVQGFMQASAGYDPHHAIAKEYLTQGKHGFARRWRPGWAATIVDHPNPEVTNLGRIVEQGGGTPAQVTVSGRHISYLRTAGRYQAGSVVVLPSATTFSFELTQVEGQYRISGITVNGKPASPTLLLLTRPDFERQYESRNLYFYPARGSNDTLVPDPVYIPAQVGTRGIRGLVQTLLKPEFGGGWLFGAAKTAFPPGTKLLGAQVVGGITAVVDLGGAAKKTSREQRQRMEAQLYSSLALQSYPADAVNPITSVVLKVDGRQVPPSSHSYVRWVPRGPKAPLYFQMPVGPRGPGVAALRAKKSQNGSVPLPKALAGRTFSSMAVSQKPTGTAVLAGCRGNFLYLMPQAQADKVIRMRLGSPCTSLSWDGAGNLWVVSTMQISVITGAGTEPPSHPVLSGVLAPTLDKARIQSMKVAPDGVRAALLISVGQSSRIRIAAISKNGGQFTYVAQNTQLLRVGTDVPHPISLAWLDPDHLLVLSQNGPRKTQLYEVPLNGGQSAPIPTPRGTKSVAASWPSGPDPTMAVAIAPTAASPNGVIQLSKTGPLNPDWHVVAKGVTPVFPG
jgi:Lipoprotein LpqB beta-propeller domain/Sporulation and spore germination